VTASTPSRGHPQKMSAGSIRPRLRPESASKVRPPSNLCRGHLPRQGAGAYFSGADGFTGRRSTSADLRVVARANFHTNPRDRRVPEPSVCSCFPSQPDPRISSVWHVWWQRGRPGQLRAAKGPASSSSDHVRISPALHLGLWQSPAGGDAALVRHIAHLRRAQCGIRSSLRRSGDQDDLRRLPWPDGILYHAYGWRRPSAVAQHVDQLTKGHGPLLRIAFVFRSSRGNYAGAELSSGRQVRWAPCQPSNRLPVCRRGCTAVATSRTPRTFDLMYMAEMTAKLLVVELLSPDPPALILG
jgi:hypothetical protein